MDSPCKPDITKKFITLIQDYKEHSYISLSQKLTFSIFKINNLVNHSLNAGLSIEIKKKHTFNYIF